MKLIVGLGNPGKQYEKTRHNVGFMVLDYLHDQLNKTTGLDNWNLSKKFNAEICSGMFYGKKIIMAKPMTFMNASGQSVQLIAHFYKLKSTDIIIVHDDKDIPIGEIKIQTNRGPAGHNGVLSIIENISTQNFTRIRVGIKPTEEKKMKSINKFVLGKFGFSERHILRKMLDTAVDAIINNIQENE